jgi:hypothetical protein
MRHVLACAMVSHAQQYPSLLPKDSSAVSTRWHCGWAYCWYMEPCLQQRSGEAQSCCLTADSVLNPLPTVALNPCHTTPNHATLQQASALQLRRFNQTPPPAFRTCGAVGGRMAGAWNPACSNVLVRPSAAASPHPLPLTERNNTHFPFPSFYAPPPLNGIHLQVLWVAV